MKSELMHHLEVTVLSCEDLRIHGKPVKKNTFVVVKTDPLNYRTTKIDTEGGSYPSWNERFVIDMPMHERFVILEARHRTNNSNSGTLIGMARIPVSDFMGGFLPNNYLNMLSYRLKDSRGERNGIINLSIRVKVPEYYSSTRKNNVCSSQSVVPVGDKSFADAVTGIPVGFANRW